MLLKIYSIYDSKVSAYGAPFFLRTRGEAIREVSDLVNDPKTKISKYPADYVLFELGSYNDENAEIIIANAPINCGVASEFVRQDVVES
jgi:hypothetical protein